MKLKNVTLAFADDHPQAHSVILYTYSQSSMNISQNLWGCWLVWEAHKVISRLAVHSSETLPPMLKSIPYLKGADVLTMVPQKSISVWCQTNILSEMTMVWVG